MNDRGQETVAERMHVNEIVITSIIFGLTLNLVADAIWEITGMEVQFMGIPIQIIAKIVLFLIAIVITFMILKRLVSGYFADNSTISANAELCFFWDASTGEVVEIRDSIPQLIFYSRLIDHMDSDDIHIQSHLMAIPNDFSTRQAHVSQVPVTLLPLFRECIETAFGYIIGLDDVRNYIRNIDEAFHKHSEMDWMEKTLEFKNGYKGSIDLLYTWPTIHPLFVPVFDKNSRIRFRKDAGQTTLADFDIPGFEKMKNLTKLKRERIYYFRTQITFRVKVDPYDLYREKNNAHTILRWAELHSSRVKKIDMAEILKYL